MRVKAHHRLWGTAGDSDLEAEAELLPQYNCRLSTGCEPEARGKDDPPGWIKELERVTKKV